jgi:hypothetical protein
MPKKPAKRSDSDEELYTTVTDELYDDLLELTGQQAVHFVLWEDSMAHALANSPDLAADNAQDSPLEEDLATIDLDIYLKDGIYFELIGAQCYLSLDSEPLSGYDTIYSHLTTLRGEGIWLDDVGVDEEDGLVLILSRQRQPLLYIPAAAWTVAEWDELPSDSPLDS